MRKHSHDDLARFHLDCIANLDSDSDFLTARASPHSFTPQAPARGRESSPGLRCPGLDSRALSLPLEFELQSTRMPHATHSGRGFKIATRQHPVVASSPVAEAVLRAVEVQHHGTFYERVLQVRGLLGGAVAAVGGVVSGVTGTVGGIVNGALVRCFCGADDVSRTELNDLLASVGRWILARNNASVYSASLHATSLHAASLHTAGVHTASLHPAGLHSAGLHSSSDDPGPPACLHAACDHPAAAAARTGRDDPPARREHDPRVEPEPSHEPRARQQWRKSSHVGRRWKLGQQRREHGRERWRERRVAGSRHDRGQRRRKRGSVLFLNFFKCLDLITVIHRWRKPRRLFCRRRVRLRGSFSRRRFIVVRA